jgi:large subunit ribosomal protein L29
MKPADLREKSVEDLTELQKSLVSDVFQNRLKNFTNRLDDTSSIRKNRRDLARVVTILREKAGKTAPAAAPEAKPSKPAKAEVKAAAPAAEGEAKPKKTAAKKPAKKSEAK